MIYRLLTGILTTLVFLCAQAFSQSTILVEGLQDSYNTLKNKQLDVRFTIKNTGISTNTYKMKILTAKVKKEHAVSFCFGLSCYMVGVTDSPDALTLSPNQTEKESKVVFDPKGYDPITYDYINPEGTEGSSEVTIVVYNTQNSMDAIEFKIMINAVVASVLDEQLALGTSLEVSTDANWTNMIRTSVPENTGNWTLTVIDLHGKPVMTHAVVSSLNFPIEDSKPTAGFYTVVLSKDGIPVRTEKMLVR